MAYDIRKIAPVDLEGRKIIGVKLPFGGVHSDRCNLSGPRERRKTTIFIPTYQTKDAIRTNLLSYFMTARGERYFNLSFGNSIQQRLFELDTPEKQQAILGQVRREIEEWFPRIEILELNLIPVVDENAIQLYLKYAIRESNTVDDLVINFANE